MHDLRGKVASTRGITYSLYAAMLPRIHRVVAYTIDYHVTLLRASYRHDAVQCGMLETH